MAITLHSNPGIGLRPYPPPTQGQGCLCVCVHTWAHLYGEGSTKNQCMALSPLSSHPQMWELGSLFGRFGTCWPVPLASQLLYSFSQQIFIEGLLCARHYAKEEKQSSQSLVKHKHYSKNGTIKYSSFKCFFLT